VQHFHCDGRYDAGANPVRTPVKKNDVPPGRYNEVPCAHVAARIVRFALMSIVFLLDKPHDQPQL
jgi:hypothetical protein